MGPDAILRGIEDRFRLLTGGARGAVPRQKTLEASVAWSYDLLDDDERALARRLSVLRGFTMEMAESVGSDSDLDRYRVLDLLTRLVDKSLVHVVHTDGDSRYRLLETVREYLNAQLAASAEVGAVRDRHLAWHMELAERLAPLLALGDGPVHLARLGLEYDNLDDALAWAAECGHHDEFLRLATALTLFWELRGHLA